MIDLVVVPVIIPSGSGLSPEAKEFLIDFFFFSICLLGWGWFFEFIFFILKKALSYLKNKFFNDNKAGDDK